MDVLLSNLPGWRSEGGLMLRTARSLVGLGEWQLETTQAKWSAGLSIISVKLGPRNSVYHEHFIS